MIALPLALLLGRSLFDHLHQPPALALGHRPAGRNGNQVAFPALIVFVMRQQFGAALDVLANSRMLHHPFNHHGDGFIRLVAHHLAGQRALFACFAHDTSPPMAFSFNTVLTRAIFLRTWKTSVWRANWPVACCMRRLNCSLRNDSSSSR